MEFDASFEVAASPATGAAAAGALAASGVVVVLPAVGVLAAEVSSAGLAASGEGCAALGQVRRSVSWNSAPSNSVRSYSVQRSVQKKRAVPLSLMCRSDQKFGLPLAVCWGLGIFCRSRRHPLIRMVRSVCAVRGF